MRRQEGIPPVTSQRSINTHKVWVIVGIVLAIVLVLLLVLYPSGKKAFFGKVVEGIDYPSPIAHYTFDSAVSSDLGMDSTATYTGTCTNCPTPSSGRRGGAAIFSGADATITIPEIILSDDFTVMFWLYETEPGVILAGSGGVSVAVTGAGFISMNVPSSWFFISISSIPTPTEVWTHYTIVNNAGVVTLYRNGELESITTPGPLSTGVKFNTIRPGWTCYEGTCGAFAGKLDDLKFFNVKLGPEEIAASAGESGVSSGGVFGTVTETTTGTEICTNGVDDDGDVQIDGADAECVGQLCDIGSDNIWLRATGGGGERTLCCSADACVPAVGSCVEYDGLYSNTVCGDANQFVECNNLNSEEYSPGRTYQCVDAITGEDDEDFVWVRCQEQWDCSEWSCVVLPTTAAGTRYRHERTCTDQNNCGTIADRPELLHRVNGIVSSYLSLSSCQVALPAERCSNNQDDDGDLQVDCADEDCGGDNVCQMDTTCALGDLDESGTLSTDDVSRLLYALDASADSDCGGTGQTVCDYSSDGYFVCDNGVVYVMADESDSTHAGDQCVEASCMSGDLDGSGTLSTDDVSRLLYALDASADSDCGGTGQTVCDYSLDGYFVCDNGVVYVMTDESDSTHAENECS